MLGRCFEVVEGRDENKNWGSVLGEDTGRQDEKIERLKLVGVGK